MKFYYIIELETGFRKIRHADGWQNGINAIPLTFIDKFDALRFAAKHYPNIRTTVELL
jgi:hypothetical protein